jgi:hypothetical protein
VIEPSEEFFSTRSKDPDDENLEKDIDKGKKGTLPVDIDL